LAVAWYSTLGIIHFVNILRFITGAALMVVLVIGCSKKTSPIPTVSFQGYGPNGATFAFGNPGKVPIVCQIQIQPGDAGGSDMIMIPVGASTTETMSVRQTNGVSLAVTVMQVTPVRQFTVLMQ
jgi:hypothetical protein